MYKYTKGVSTLNCQRCNKQNIIKYGSGKFCSKSCANSRGPRSKEVKDKISSSLKGNTPWNKNKECKRIERENRICIHCNNTFCVPINSTKKYCSIKCVRHLGGYREGSGRSKSGYYKGVYCGSTYELAWVIYRIDHNLPFERFETMLVGNGIKYLPDFKDGNTIYEIKGYENKSSVDAKTELAIMNGYEVIVLRKEQLKIEFEWVKNNYNFKHMNELYDNYKPKYVYRCHTCNVEVNRERQSKTAMVFCSRKHAGPGIRMYC